MSYLPCSWAVPHEYWQISIPLETVVSIDRTSLDFVDALTIRVSDSESGIEGDAYPFCYLSNMQAAFDRLRSLLADFKLRREHWTSQTSSQPGSQGPRVKGLATEALAPSPSTTPLAASRLALHRSNSTPSQESVTAQEAFVSPSPPKEATRKASIETIKRGNVFPDVETLQTSPIPIQKQPSLASNSSSHDHTYPPDTLSNSPDEPLSTTPSRNYMQWPVPDWLRSAPKLISAVTRPPTIGLDWPAAPARRIMEVLSSPTQPDRNLRTATREEAGPSKAQDDLQSIFLLPQEEQIDFSRPHISSQRLD